jgi:DHA1 family bicyclomycin/chloramphenicol resistance-like MFS transporter
VISGYASGRLAGRMAPERQVRLGFRVLLTLTAAMLLLQCFVADPPIFAQQLVLVGTAVGVQLLFPIITLRIFDLFPEARGAASSMQSFSSLILSTVMMGVVSPLLSASLAALAAVAFAGALGGWLLWRWAERCSPRRHDGGGAHPAPGGT